MMFLKLNSMKICVNMSRMRHSHWTICKNNHFATLDNNKNDCLC